jgi:hypothetical protein
LGPGVRYKTYPITPAKLRAATIIIANIAAPPQRRLHLLVFDTPEAKGVDTVFTR